MDKRSKSHKNHPKYKSYSLLVRGKAIGQKSLETLKSVINRRPMTSFFSLLVLLLALIIIGNFLRQPQKNIEETSTEPVAVEVFSIGEAPKMAFSGIVEKSGVVTLTAQSPGVVNYVSVFEGQRVYKGQGILGLGTSYNGASLASVSRQIAEQNYTFTDSNFPIQQELINKRKQLANTLDGQADKLRDLTAQSITDTKNQITLNEQILQSLDEQIGQLEQSNTDGSNDALLLQTKQAKSGVYSGLSALRGALRTIEYQSSNSTEPATLSDISRELTLKQLEIEEKALSLGKEIARLNLSIARISESLMYPVSPAAGIVERVFVYPGQSVNPGTPLVALSFDTSMTYVRVRVSSEIAKELSRLEKSKLLLGGSTLELLPTYISSEPTEGSLHTVTFTIPKEFENTMTDTMSIIVEMPIGQAKATQSVPFVPLDSVFQAQDEAVVYIASPSANNTYVVTAKTVELGAVFGSFVQVIKGLSSTDQVILERSILSGDTVVLQ